MPASFRNGWGFISNLVGVSTTVAGVNTVNKNVGVGAAIQAVSRIRLAKLCWRIDLAPDVPAGTVAAPSMFRLVVLAGANNPPDVSQWQTSAFGSAAAHPEVPQMSPLEVLFDQWLELQAQDPGLNALAFIDFADAGPSVEGGATMLILLTPMLTTMSQAILPTNGTVTNAQLTLAAYGLADGGSPTGGTTGSHTGRSIPRYDVAVNG